MLVAVVLVVMIALAIIAYYLLSASPSVGTSTASSTPQTSSTSAVSTTPVTATSSSTSTSISSPLSTTSSTTSSSTSSSTVTIASSSTSTTTTSTAACLTTSPSNSTEEQELVGWFGNYTSLAISFQGTTNNKALTLDFSYSVVYKSATTYKVSINVVLNGKSHPYTLWDLTNGTVLALLAPNGVNSTGSAASNTVLGYFSDLETLDTLGLQSTNAAYFHSTGTSTVTIGTNSFTVTNYVANTTPETIQGCNNSGSGSLSNYSVNLGTPNGSSFELVVSATFAGSITDASGTRTFDITYQTTAFTIA